MLPVLLLALLVKASALLLPTPSAPSTIQEGCRYRKVLLHQASLLEASEPLERWLTLDGKPCSPASRFHWRPSAAAPTVTYAPVEVSNWASAADKAVGTDRTQQKEFLKAQGLDVTEDEIRKALPSLNDLSALRHHLNDFAPPAPPVLPAPTVPPAPPLPVGEKTEKLQDLDQERTEKLKAIDHKVDKLAKKLEPKVEHIQSISGKVDHLLKRLHEAEKLVTDAPTAEATGTTGATGSAQLRKPAASAPTFDAQAQAPAPASVQPAATTPARQIDARASPAPIVAAAPAQAPAAEATGTTGSAQLPKTTGSAPARQIDARASPAPIVAAAPAQATVVPAASTATAPQVVRTDSLSAEAKAKMEAIEDKLDQLGETLKGQASRAAKAVAKAQEPAKAFMNSHVAQVAQVELMDVKTDVQQEILTHALDGQAKMQGQVEAAHHQRKEILQKLNVTMQKRVSKARASLDDAESQVAETARHMVKEAVGNVTREFSVQDVSTDAEKLKAEAESLQSNISTLLSHVERDSGLAKEIVSQLPDSQQVELEVRGIKADVKEINVEAKEAEDLAGESLVAAETAMQVLNRSDVMAQEAKDLKLRAAQQAAENRAKILEIVEIFGK